MDEKTSVKTFLYWLGSLAFIVIAAGAILSGPLLSPSPAPSPAAKSAPVVPKNDLPVRRDAPRTYEPLGARTRFYQRREMTVDGADGRHTLVYFLYAPKIRAPAGYKFPLILVLHDGHGRAQAGEYLVDGDWPARFPAYIAVPVLPYGKKWAVPETFDEVPGFVPLPREREGLPDAAALARALGREYPVDKRRIYAVGCSDGGFGAFGAAARYPDLFAAAVPISSGWTAAEATELLGVPLWVLHGSGDPVFPARLSRDAVSAIKGMGGLALYTEYPGLGHDCGSPLFYPAALWRWLFSQARPEQEKSLQEKSPPEKPPPEIPVSEKETGQ